MERYSGIEIGLEKVAAAEGAFEGFSKDAIKFALNAGATTHSEVKTSEFRFISQAPLMVGYEGGKPKIFITRDGKRYNVQVQQADRLQSVRKQNYDDPQSARAVAEVLSEIGIDVMALDWKWIEKGKRSRFRSERDKAQIDAREKGPVGTISFDRFRALLQKQFAETQKESIKQYLNEIVEAVAEEFDNVISGKVTEDYFRSKAAKQLQNVANQVERALEPIGRLIRDTLHSREWNQAHGRPAEKDAISQRDAQEIIKKMVEISKRKPGWWEGRSEYEERPVK